MVAFPSAVLVETFCFLDGGMIAAMASLAALIGRVVVFFAVWWSSARLRDYRTNWLFVRGALGCIGSYWGGAESGERNGRHEVWAERNYFYPP